MSVGVCNHALNMVGIKPYLFDIHKYEHMERSKHAVSPTQTHNEHRLSFTCNGTMCAEVSWCEELKNMLWLRIAVVLIHKVH